MVLDLMYGHDFHCQVVKRVKILLFLVQTLVYQDILIPEENILVLGEAPTQGLDDTTLLTEVKYSNNITKPRNKTCLSMHYNTGNSSFILMV